MAKFKVGEVTSEQFDAKLIEIMATVSAGALIQIPGVYEACSEHFNNEVLQALEDDHARAMNDAAAGESTDDEATP